MKKLILLNFQNIVIKGEHVEYMNFPIRKFEKEPKYMYVVIIRNPYDFINTFLNDCIQKYPFSPTLKHLIALEKTEDIVSYVKEKKFFPLFNPQTFNLDAKTKLDQALENLKLFDRIIDYDDIDALAHEFNLTIGTHKKQHTIHLEKTNTIDTLIQKDLELYRRAFDPKLLAVPIKVDADAQAKIEVKCRGYVDKITNKSISGWALIEGREDSCEVDLYIDNKKIQTITANIARPGIQERGLHPTGKCGYMFQIAKSTDITTSSTIEVKIKNHDFLLTKTENAKKIIIS